MALHVVKEAQRCLHCKKPLCIMGCPIHTDIPGMIERFVGGKIRKAGETLFRNNPLSVICSLVCNHENQCEGHCVLGKTSIPVHISSIENYISEFYLDNFMPQTGQKKGMRTAIIGSGPAGITIAVILAQKGYDVTIFEARDRIGGILRFGIPDFRLPKRLIDKYHEKLISAGIKIRANTTIGGAIGIDDLFRDEYRTIFIGTGVWRPKKLNIKGETLGHVRFAIDYLASPEACPVRDRRVIIIGGGNSAMDAARTAIHRGARDVTVFLRHNHAAATDREIEYAMADGVSFEYNKRAVEIKDEGVIFCDVAYDEDGQPNDVPDSQSLFPADVVIVAISQGPKDKIVATTTGITVDNKGLILVDDCGHTTRKGIFASGDVVLGAKTVVEAVNDSKRVAEAMDEYMRSLAAEEENQKSQTSSSENTPE